MVKDTTPNMMNPRLYTTSYNKPQGQQFDTAVLSFIKLQYTEKSCKMINIFVRCNISRTFACYTICKKQRK